MTTSEIKTQIEKLATEEGVDFIAAASGFQTAAALKGDEDLIATIGKLKLAHLGI